jgi:hypothetical protein
MTDQRNHAPDEYRADNTNLGGEGDGDSPKLRTSTDGDSPELADVVDDPTRQNDDTSGLPEDDEAEWEERGGLEGVDDADGDAAVDDRIADDKER